MCANTSCSGTHARGAATQTHRDLDRARARRPAGRSLKAQERSSGSMQCSNSQRYTDTHSCLYTRTLHHDRRYSKRTIHRLPPARSRPCRCRGDLSAAEDFFVPVEDEDLAWTDAMLPFRQDDPQSAVSAAATSRQPGLGEDSEARAYGRRSTTQEVASGFPVRRRAERRPDQSSSVGGGAPCSQWKVSTSTRDEYNAGCVLLPFPRQASHRRLAKETHDPCTMTNSFLSASFCATYILPFIPDTSRHRSPMV